MNGGDALLQLDGAAGVLDLALQLLGLVLVDAFLDRLRRLVDERLRLLQAEAGRGANDPDDLDLLFARAGQDDVERARPLVLGSSAVASAGRGRRGGRHGRRRNAELLLE